MKKEIHDTAVEDIRNLFRLKKENKATKNRIIRDIRNLFEHEEDYHKPVRVGNFWINNYIEHESNSDRNRTLCVEEYLNKIMINGKADEVTEKLFDIHLNRYWIELKTLMTGSDFIFHCLHL